MRILGATLLFLLAVGGAVGCGGSGSDSTTTTQASFDGSVAKPTKPVPPLALDNSLGAPVNIDDYKGKAVLVTFIYDHCPDICPLIVGNLRAAQKELGAKADDMQIIAVSVDPEGDTPTTVKKFLADHQMTGRMQYLIGSRQQLENTWADWNIITKKSSKKGDPDAVEHSALIYGISASGKITTLYPANFKPKWIVHDAPLLASS
ncbi:MAG: SCO family protein [Solirubrobacterales bacterium]